MKIVYVIDTLASKGGAERILSDKMNYMANRFGYDVYVITCYQNPQENPNVYYLSDKVKQIDLKSVIIVSIAISIPCAFG